MRRVLLFVLVAAVVVTAAWFLAGVPGHVSATIAGTTFEASAPVTIALLLAVVLAVHLLLRLLAGLVHIPGRVGRWGAQRRRGDGDAAVSRTLVALAAGQGGDARREAERARRLLGDTPQTLLLAAEARRLANDDDGATELYEAMVARPDSGFLGLRGLFRQAMAREDWVAAAQLAREAEAVHPGGGWLRTERAQLAVRLGEWTQALALAGPDAPAADFALAAAQAEGDPVQATGLAKRAWRANPGLAPAALTYARLLRRKGRDSKALDVVLQAWALSPQPDLAAFALEKVADPLARVKIAERFAQRNPSSAESHFLLAKETLAAGQTGAARRHVEAARRGGLTQKRLWLLLADLEIEERGDTEQGRIAQRDALRQATRADADPAWRCETCGTVYPAWRPDCPACHTAGRIRWGGPTRLVLAGPQARRIAP